MSKSRIFLMLLMLLCMGSITTSGQEKKTVSGTVLDSAGHAVKDVSVYVRNGSTGTSTDAEGHFKILASAKDVLVFSAIGYTRNEVPVGSKTNFTVSLVNTSAGLEEAVVTSLGIKRSARSLGYAVSTISAKDLTESGSTNFASALYGKAAGVKVTTAPGGASSAVAVQIRGVGSVGLNTQPLYVVDGVPIRLYNDAAGNLGNNSNNNGYWSNTRISGNGVLDINPEDIESLTVLKGASASALYGSEAMNGVVVITTKKGGKGKGLGVDVNYIYAQEKLANSPDYQNDYGPGYDAQTNVANGIADATGWATADSYHHPYYRAYAMFGPKFDGSQIRYWDGTMRPYVAQPNNYRNFFNTGYNSNGNVAVSNSSEKGSYRFSYTRQDYKSIVPGSDLNKNNFNFNGTLKLSDRVSVDLISTYNYNFTHNRPQLMSQVFASYGGFFSRLDDMKTYFNKFQTTDGYKYVLPSNTSYDQDQKLAYNVRATQLMDYMWTALKDNYDETQNRFINSVTLNVGISRDVKFRGRIGGDFTSLGIEEKDHNTQPVATGNSGSYTVTNSNYNIVYGDALLTYSPKITQDLTLGFTGGVTGRKQTNKYLKSATTTGLQDENFFSLNNSVGALSTNAYRTTQTDVAAFGLVNVNYKSFLYVEGTGRYEATSTLPPATNNYFYPSVNAGFVLSDVIRMPAAVSYAKLRASYAIVGNHPNIYQSNVAYNQTGIVYANSNVLYQFPNTSNFGNERLESERKREAEFGLETRFLNDRVGLDLSYYNGHLDRQILPVSLSTTTGAAAFVANAGTLNNYGVEAAITATPIITRNFRWTTRFNFAVNRNKLQSLPNGQSTLTMSNQDGGYLIVQAKAGDALGNVYVHPKATDAKGNAIIDDYGLYTVNTDAYKYVGNIMPKVVGGFSNSVSYKNFSLDFTIDYRFGGKLVSIPSYYQVGAGMYKSTLKYRDAAHGGISYNVNSDANADYTAAANGSRNDGVILKGVTAAGAANTKVITAAMYYLNTYNWETAGLYENAVYDNSYIKLREVTLTYNLPGSLSSKVHCQNLQVAFIARNLFYIYKTLPYGLDPEVPVGSSWLAQGIDGGSVPPTRSLGVSLRAKF